MTTRSGRQQPQPSARTIMRMANWLASACAILLGGCAESGDLLPSLNLDQTETSAVSTDKPAAAGEQTELQKATLYWGQEYAKKPAELKPALNYAKNLKAMGEKRKAMAVLQQASLLHDGDKELASEYGRLALELDQVGMAAQALSVADDPANPDWRIISARGTVFAKQGKYREAIPFYERALSISQNNPTVMNNLAMAYAMMGDAKKAEGILRDAANSKDASPKVKENLALVLGLQGRYDESKSIATEAEQSATASADVDYLKKMVKAPAVPAPATAPTTWATTAKPAKDTKEPLVQKAAAKAPAPAASADATVWKTNVAAASAPASK